MATPRILVIEDEILIAREIEGCLQRLGYDVVGIATKAEVALQRISEEQPDLVLVDIRLQGEQDGISVGEQMRTRFQIPFIYVTAYVDDKTLGRAKLTHPSGYILKPFKQNDLRAAVEIALARHQAEMQEKSVSEVNANSQSFEYLAVLSHELRSPISAIMLSTKMLGDSQYPISETKRQELLQRIQWATSHMNQLIEDVLTIGQTEHHTTPFQPEITDIVEFCQTLIEPFQWNSDQQHSIHFSYAPQRIYASVDQKLLWHLLSNLLSNAIKYSPEGRLVSLRLQGTEQDIQFEIQDQGIGIPPENLACIFQPFQRGRNVGKLPGTGLGLAIAKRVIELHSGEITVESQVGLGSKFIVTLPQGTHLTIRGEG